MKPQMCQLSLDFRGQGVRFHELSSVLWPTAGGAGLGPHRASGRVAWATCSCVLWGCDCQSGTIRSKTTTRAEFTKTNHVNTSLVKGTLILT